MIYKNTHYGFHGCGLGNQMFQLSILFSIWKETNQNFFLNKTAVKNTTNPNIFACFDIDIDVEDVNRINNLCHNNGCPFEFYEHVYKQPLGTEFSGYFQNKKYYEKYQKELIHFLKFKQEHIDSSYDIIKWLKTKYNLPLVSVHYRRKDYVTKHMEQKVGNLSKSNYYQTCVDLINYDCVYLIFSDDIGWCRQNIKFKNKNIEFMDSNFYQTLYLMSICDVNIIANSTYSWWGAFLNINSKVYAPSKWTGSEDKPNGCNDNINLLLDNWNRIEVKYTI